MKPIEMTRRAWEGLADPEARKSPRLIDLPGEPGPLGDLVFIQSNLHLPFTVRRVYFVHGIPHGAVRGGHAHKRCHELLVAASGAMTVSLEAQDGTMYRCRLDHPAMGLYVPPLYWRVVRDYAAHSLCLVIASEDYDPAEYLRNPDQFRIFERTGDANPLS